MDIKILKQPAAPEVIKAISDNNKGINIFDIDFESINFLKHKNNKIIVLTPDNSPNKEKGMTP